MENALDFNPFSMCEVTEDELKVVPPVICNKD